MNSPQLVTNSATWQTVANELSREPQLALDTESNSLHAYQERVCLIQIAGADKTYLLDPLAVDDMGPLSGLLTNPDITKIIHGSDYDLRSLNRDYGFVVKGLFDTQLAARFLGTFRSNLASVLEEYLEVDIPKSRKIQTSDWSLRPLSSVAIEYAANDVAHLAKLAETMRERLEEAGRLEWVEEECLWMEQARHSPSQKSQEAFLRLKGADRLSPRQLAVLRELHQAREDTAARENIPAFKILSNETLVQIASSSAEGPIPAGRIENRDEFIQMKTRRWGDLVKSAVERGLKGPEFRREGRSKPANPWNSTSKAKLQQFKTWRNKKGESLGLDPSLLWPTVSLERWALGEHFNGNHPEVRAWQRREFAEELEEIVSQSP